MKKSPYQNQHYISKVLLRRFSKNGVLQKYHVEHDSWGQAGLENTFAHFGYTQLLSNGAIDNTLETAFGKLETLMPKALAALDDAATREKTALSVKLYSAFCWYLAFLHCLSPFFKAKSPEDFLHDLHVQMINRNGDLLDAIKFTKQEIEQYRASILNGDKIVIDSQHCLQFLHRVQFNRVCKAVFYYQFRYVTTWHICRSPIDLPLCDVAITPILARDIHWYSMPISPRLFLVGRIPQTAKNRVSKETIVHTVDLPLRNAENWKDLICLQARVALISKERFPDIAERKKRAIEAGHAFANIQEIDKVISAGTVENLADLKFKRVSQKEFEAFTNKFVTNKNSPDLLSGATTAD